MTRTPHRPLLTRVVDTGLDLAVVPGYTKIGLGLRSRLPGWPADPAPDALVGRTTLVTGASSGLGEATALALARLGGRVLLGVRDEAKGGRVRGELLDHLRRDPGAADPAALDDALEVVRVDVGDLDDVRRCAEELVTALNGAGRTLDVLVHNAGVMPKEWTASPQGHEQTMAVHVLGPVLLTDLLRGVLGPDARVVLVTSGGMYAQALRADDPEFRDGRYSGTTAYARSKRAQVELAPLLARRWAPAVVATTHPGWADTPGVVDSLPGFHKLTGPLLRDPAGGADTAVWLAATSDDVPSGRLWHDRAPRPVALVPGTRADDADRQRLWAWVREQLDL